MSTKTSPKAKTQALQLWISRNEVDLFLAECSVLKAKEPFEADTRLRTTHEQFAAAAKETRIWLWRRKSQTKDTCLDYKGWDRLNAAAVELADLLQGLRIDQAVEVMLTRVRCNAFLLQGMTQKHRFWEHPKSEVLQ